MNFVGRLIHAAYFVVVRGTVDPNLPEDRRGLFSALFSALAADLSG
jgi:beta-hydroxylase